MHAFSGYLLMSKMTTTSPLEFYEKNSEYNAIVNHSSSNFVASLFNKISHNGDDKVATIDR